MSESARGLVERLRSEDFNERAKALAALVAQGTSSVPALTQALAGGDERVRAQAAKGLAELADPGSADTLAALTYDSASEVRAQAAAGLARIGDARAIEALVRTIDDAPDELHHPYTLSVYCLIDMGDAARAAVMPLLSADDPNTRARASLVLHSVAPRVEE